MRIVVASDPRSYREAIGLAIEGLRPSAEVVICAPDALGSEVSRLGPQLVIYGPEPADFGAVPAWIRLDSSGVRQRATIWLGEDRLEIANVQLVDLLSIVDRAAKLADLDGPPRTGEPETQA